MAQRLLDDAALGVDSEELIQPHPIRLEQPDFTKVAQAEEKLVVSPIIVVTGTVTTEGRVDGVEVRMPSGVEVFDQLCATALREALYRPALYRPARGEDGYVESEVGVTCHLLLR